MTGRRDYAREIAAAMSAGDVETLGAIAIELAAKVHSDEERREKAAAKKRGQRARESSQMSLDVSGQTGTGRDSEGRDGTAPSSPSPSSSFPTPHITPTSSPSPHSASNTAREATEPAPAGVVERAALLSRLTTDRCRSAVARFLDAVAIVQNPVYWATEIAGWLEGLNMPRLQPPAEEDIAQGLAEFGRLTKPEYAPELIRRYVIRAKADRIEREQRANPSLASARPHLTRSQRLARDEREAEAQAELRTKWGHVEARRARGDGEEWWTRMKSEAQAMGLHPITYGYDHRDEPAAPGVAAA